MCLISESSNVVRSVVKPALHVGEQIAGGSGCFAAVGNGGIAAGGGSCGCKGLAQALSSSASGSSISASALGTLVGFIGDLLNRGDAALFLEPDSLHGRQRLLRALGALFRDLLLQARQAVRLQDREGAKNGAREGKGAGDHDVNAVAMALATNHLRS